MKKAERETTNGMAMKAPNCVAILAILGEMARHVNENISKVDLKPIHESLLVRNAVDSAGVNS